MKKNLIFIIFLFLIAVLVLFAYGEELHIFPEKNDIPNVSSGINAPASTDSGTPAVDSGTVLTGDAASNSGDPTYNWVPYGDSLPLPVNATNTATLPCGLKYTVDAVSISKDTQGMQVHFEPFEVEMDTDGTLISAHSYICITLTIENIHYYDSNVCFGSCDLFIYDSDNVIYKKVGTEIELFDINQGKGQDAYFCDIPKGENIQFTIGVIVEDSVIQNGTDFIFAATPAYHPILTDSEDNPTYWQWNRQVGLISLNEFLKEN